MVDRQKMGRLDCLDCDWPRRSPTLHPRMTLTYPLTKRKIEGEPESVDDSDDDSWGMDDLFDTLFRRRRPQHHYPKITQDRSEEEQAARQREISQMKMLYKWSYDSPVAPAPMLLKVPKRENPSTAWSKKLFSRLATVLGSKFTGILASLDLGDLSDVLEFIPTTFSERKSSMGSINKELHERGIACEKIPASSDFFSDEAFVRYRLAGPNPLALEKCTCAVLDKMNLAASDRVPYDELLAADRLYCVDYEKLRALNFTPGKVKGEDGQEYHKHPAYPIALFELPDASTEEGKLIGERQGLVARAIQCMPGVAGSTFTPQDENKRGWEIAKMVLNSTDGDYHEGVAHLAHTHLLLEVFAIATSRTLLTGHPIAELLRPHFKGTLFINHRAVHLLVGEGGPVDLTFSQGVNDVIRVAVAEALSLLSDDFSFPKLLERKGLDEQHFPTLFYPYREDGTLIWEAISEFVTGYVGKYYEDKDSIEDDDELQAWVAELKDDTVAVNGELKTYQRCGWMNSFDNTPEMLSRVLSAVIFTASAQHAAVNFPQRTALGWAPAFPLGLYKSVPLSAEEATEERFMDMLPPMEILNFQRDVGNLLGGVYHTQLMSYDGHFKDPKVAGEVKLFEQRMKHATRTIQKRNKKRVVAWANTDLDPKIHSHWAYKVLLPSNIPRSTNI